MSDAKSPVLTLQLDSRRGNMGTALEIPSARKYRSANKRCWASSFAYRNVATFGWSLRFLDVGLGRPQRLRYLLYFHAVACESG